MSYVPNTNQKKISTRNIEEHQKKQSMRDKSWKLGPLSFNILSGERVGIIGDSGSGKTSLLYAIQHYGEHEEVEVHYEGTLHRPKDNIFSVMQEAKSVLNPIRTVYGLFRVLHHSRKSKRTQAMNKQEIITYLSLMGFNNFEHIFKAHPHQLSGGMAQRVMCALVLALEPEWILADEISASLDVSYEEKIMEVLYQQVSTVIMVTHRLHLVKKYCHRVMFLEQGKILYDGSVRNFFECPHPVIQEYIDNIMLDNKGST